jgi:hypothetical protein
MAEADPSITIEEFKEKVIRDLKIIMHGLPPGGIKVVGSVSLALQSIYAFENKKSELTKSLAKMDKGLEYFEELLTKSLKLVDDYDIVVTGTTDSVVEYYTNLQDKGFIKDKGDSNKIPSFEDIDKGIKMIYKSKNPLDEIKIDYIGETILSKPKRKTTPIILPDDSPSIYRFVNDFSINILKVNELREYYAKINNNNNNLNNNNEKKGKIKEKRQIKNTIYTILAGIYPTRPIVNVRQASANHQHRFRSLSFENDQVTPPPSSRRRLVEPSTPPLPSFRLPTFGGSKRKQTNKKPINKKKTKKKGKKLACSSCGWRPIK